MIGRTIEAKRIEQLSKFIDESRKVVITCHIAPDGDALGSSLALAAVLKALKKDVRVVTPDTPPKILRFLPGFNEIVVFSKNEELTRKLFAAADLIFSLDYNALSRIDRVGPYLKDSTARKVMIDHHLYPENFTDIVISHPEDSSTSMLIYKVLCQLGMSKLINKTVAKCIYTGMMTDTGNFAYNSNDPDIYLIISELLKRGVNKDEIYNRVFNTTTASRLRLNGFALSEKMKIFEGHHAALITLTRKELNKFHYHKGDTESLVNQPLKVPEVIYSFYLREESDYIKVSARSRGNFPVNKICEKHFGGGGHLNAAGGEFRGTMEEAIEKFMSILDENDEMLNS